MKDHAYRPFFPHPLRRRAADDRPLAADAPSGDTQLRRIDLLSDLGNDSTKGDFHDVIPKPKEPERLLAKNKAGRTVAFKEVWPKGVERIVDFSAGSANGMDHFYAMLDSVKRKQLKGASAAHRLLRRLLHRGRHPRLRPTRAHAGPLRRLGRGLDRRRQRPDQV